MIINKVKGLRGEINVASDKSISHRGVIIGAISKGTTLVENFLMGEDCLSTISCFEKMGVEIIIKGNSVTIEGNGLHGLKASNEVLYTGNSGTTTRLLCGLLAPQNFNSTIDGDASIRKRPMNRVIKPLSEMGAHIEGKNAGYAPIHIKGSKLNGIEYTMPVASAQLKSSIILAGLYAFGQTKIKEPISSRNHTEIMLNGFGGNIRSDDNAVIVNPVEELYGNRISVPGDISSAAFFLVGGLIVPNSEIVIKNVGLNKTRTGIIDVLKSMGGSITIENINNEIEPSADIIVKSSELKGIEVSGDLIPRLIDEIPIIAVAAAFAKGTTVIKNAEELKVKESNRIEAMENELKKANVDIIGTDDGFIINGGKNVLGANFETYNDHRIAMSMTILALAADGESKIQNPDCIKISYPEFFDTLRRISL
ncbi:3-phosphoshikimate 1-carboxyvinyltransferase [Anaerovorax odorimutans]|uniref:3-phosphoshikimate 1-carboxyvinyltransferase n=1 Tax=Anaerovorax odorimutans TaxID=109327 RepID=UPI000413AAA7|nr:3-phosphoshikimate 1-carboxyvinyltransferase [Anaerovorax odorimutans]